MSSDSDAKRIASGPLPSQLVRAHVTRHGAHGVQPDASPDPQAAAPFDPLRLCIFATIALLGWLAGPAALAVFAAIGFVGYWKARRKGLTKSNCYLRDTRLVLAYLGLLLGAGLWGMYALVVRLAGL
ncbi:hypothetical protein JOE31_000607 [Arthrobacter sp. PvP023]|uniref:hypothetical protein n=1 Tax=Micrococcaceae TaxID=1268 RepID=UPI001AE24B81|nr:hypothetical protein [Arthrobacter sp. PvP023]MBP1134375.1 hypothetical protein [Arthrobacter sp. PvP023]